MTEMEARRLMTSALSDAGLSDPFVLGLFGGNAVDTLAKFSRLRIVLMQKTRHYRTEAVQTESSGRKISSSLIQVEHSTDITAISQGLVLYWSPFFGLQTNSKNYNVYIDFCTKGVNHSNGSLGSLVHCACRTNCSSSRRSKWVAHT